MVAVDFKRFFLDVEGITRYHYLFVPQSALTGGPVPLVILLHGAGGNPRTAKNVSDMNRLALQQGFIVSYPQGTGPGDRELTWNTGHCCGFAYENGIDDVSFIANLMDELAVEWPVDEQRIYVAGISNGAMMTHRLACQLSGRIAAIAAVAGTMPPLCEEPAVPVPVIMFHGTADLFVPYNGGLSASSAVKKPVEHRSVRQTVDSWLRFNHCSVNPRTEKTGVVTTEFYSGQEARQDVVLVKIDGGGHTWPGTYAGEPNPDDPMQQLSATQMIWDFFLRHPANSTNFDTPS